MESSSAKKEPLAIHPYPISSPLAAKLRQKLMAQRQRIAIALEPELTRRVKDLIKHKYNRVLSKVEKARNQLEIKGFGLRNTDRSEFLRDKAQLEKFNNSLSEHLHDLIPELLNQIAFKISRCLHGASSQNILAKTIQLYPSLMGAYLYKPTLKQMLTPTVRTLHQLQQHMMDNYTEARGTQNSLWVLMYLVSAVFVHLFGKYITPFQKIVVAEMVKEAFVISVVYVATGLEVEGVDEENMDSSIEKWLIELKYMTGKSMSCF